MTTDKSGIYILRNLINNKIYVGSAVNLKRREYEHFYYFEKDVHHNIYLQRSGKKYGTHNFRFDVVLLCDPENVLLYEQMFLDALSPEYNMCKVAGNILGLKRSEETKKKLSIARRKRIITKETRKKLSMSGMGRIVLDETRKKISIANMGSKRSDESKKRMSESHQGQIPCNLRKWPDFISPDGVIYFDIANMTRFSKKHGLNNSHMTDVANGKRNQHLGWRLA